MHLGTHYKRSAVWAAAVTALVLLFTSQQAHSSTCSGGWDYMPEAPGKVAVAVERGNAAASYGLSKPESAAYDQALQRLLDAVLDQPHLKPPHGTDLQGWLRQWEAPACAGRRPCRGVPVLGQGVLRYHYLLKVDGAPQPIIETSIAMDLAVNDMDAVFSHDVVSQDSDGRPFYAQPQPWGHLDGVPVYTHFGRGTMSLVFARGGRALWRPVSNEQVLRAAIKRLQTEVLAFKPVTAAPAAALYAQWLADAPQRKRQTEATLDAVRRGNPAGAEALRQEMARMHAEMEEGFRRDAEHEQVRLTQASQQQPKSRPMTVHDVLKRHQDWLVRLSPGQRAAQAISLRAELPDPSLAVVQEDSPDFAERLRIEGRALVQSEPAYFDSRLPRTALQVVVLRTGIRLLDPLKPNDCGEINPGLKALWQTMHTTPWARIQRLLAP